MNKNSKKQVEDSESSGSSNTSLPKNVAQTKLAADEFLKHFDPNVSRTETVEKKKIKAVLRPEYDEKGVHIASGIDMCDCLNEKCEGCAFPCPQCDSQKCGLECRVNREFAYEEITYDGSKKTVKNPLLKK